MPYSLLLSLLHTMMILIRNNFAFTIMLSNNCVYLYEVELVSLKRFPEHWSIGQSIVGIHSHYNRLLIKWGKCGLHLNQCRKWMKTFILEFLYRDSHSTKRFYNSRGLFRVNLGGFCHLILSKEQLMTDNRKFKDRLRWIRFSKE